jgi:hypothetical protein
MTDAVPTDSAPSLHDLRGALNGVILQLELAAIALGRQDSIRAGRAVDQARAAADELATLLERAARASTPTTPAAEPLP